MKISKVIVLLVVFKEIFDVKLVVLREMFDV